ncbi:MAG: hypothetical protein ACLURP_14000 [Ruminococcus sp.]
MNPIDVENSEPNFWLSCLMIDEAKQCASQVRGECEDVCYVPEHGKSCPTEILETIAKYNAEGRPVWKPMHMQPIYRMNGFVTREGNGRAKNKCLYRRWSKRQRRQTAGCGNGYLSQRPVPAQ